MTGPVQRRAARGRQAFRQFFVKPDGRIDVFAGTSDIGNGSKTIQSQIVAETIGVPYEWITYDNSNTDSSPVCTGTFASRATFVAGKAVEAALEEAFAILADKNPLPEVLSFYLGPRADIPAAECGTDQLKYKSQAAA